MFATLTLKELKSILLSPKFPATFAVYSILMLLSVYIGIKEYRVSARQYETAQQLVDQRLQEQSSWAGISSKTFRKPDPMQVFVGGLNYDIGRFSLINTRDAVRLQNSVYSDDPIYAVFRFIDFTFIVQVVLSLFAILFTYNAINGEREDGTLRLVFSNAVPRAGYILAKCVGSWIGLVVPIAVPVLLSLLMVLLFKVPLTGAHWMKLFTLLGISVLFFTFFIVLGVFISTLTKRSSVSFLIALMVWITFVLIIPRAGVLAANQLVQVPSVGEIEGQREAYSKQRWAEYMKAAEERWMERHETQQEEEELDEARLWEIMEEEDKLRKEMEAEIEEFGTRLGEDLRRRKAVQEKLALTLTRFSPASAYQLAAMSLAGTDLMLKTRYEDAMINYRSNFKAFIEKKMEENPTDGRIMISASSDGELKISNSRSGGSLDISELPRFTTPEMTYAQSFAPTIIDFGLLALYTLLAFAGAFARFLRYDTR